jgi:hypothetical protein
MSDYQFLQRQVMELTRLRKLAAKDPILEPQLQERLDEASAALEHAQRIEGSLIPRRDPEMPRAAIFLRGGGVNGSEGIRPNLAGNVLIQYEKMFTAQAIHDERQAALRAGRQRRPRGAPTPELLFTSTPRGSFGMEFVPQTTSDPSMLLVHGQSFKNIARAITAISANDAKVADEAIQKIPSAVLQPLKQFVRVLSDYQAELRLAFPDERPISVTSAQLRSASDRLEREVAQDILELQGVFRGVTRESGHFDLKIESGDVITGIVADTFSEDDLSRVDQLTNKLCRATIQRTVVSTVAGALPPEYILLDAIAAN